MVQTSASVQPLVSQSKSAMARLDRGEAVCQPGLYRTLSRATLVDQVMAA